MKRPNINSRVICPACWKPKFLFDTKEKAIDHIKWNSSHLKGKVFRYYWCAACCGYHITSHFNPQKQSNVKRLIKAYNRDIENINKIRQ